MALNDAKTKSLKSVISKAANPKELINAIAQAMVETGEHDDEIRTTAVFSKETAKIIIPEGMSKLEASKDLKNQWENEEQEQDFVTMFEGWNYKDVLYAIRNTIEDHFGWIAGRPTRWESPTEIDIITNYKNGSAITEKAFIGPVRFPAYEDAPGDVGVNRGGVAYITISAKRKFGEKITLFFNAVRNFLNTRSIYRGKAVSVTWNQKYETVDMELIEILPNNNIVLNNDEEMVVQNFVLSQLDDEGKRCFLFTGSYGNGKTETAMRVGYEANKKGMSFFYVKDSALFSKVLGFAKNYEPCVIFMEDIDEIASGEERTNRMNDILNTIDGVETKGRSILTIFTTNHHKRINPALRRPGRIDLIINFSNPDKETVKKIAEKFFLKLNGGSTLDFDSIAAKMPEAQGAVIAEICKRSLKLYEKEGKITQSIVEAAIVSIKHQTDFMNDDVEKSNSLQESFYQVRQFLNGDVNF